MASKRTQEAIDTYVNGNVSDFKAWLKTARKSEILAAIEYYSGTVGYGGRHEIINAMRNLLEN